jgi:integrase
VTWDRPRLAQVPARKLRAAFATMASRMGAQNRILKAYLGHAAGDILGDHYRRINMDELRQVSGLIKTRSWQKAGNIRKTGDARRES